MRAVFVCGTMLVAGCIDPTLKPCGADLCPEVATCLDDLPEPRCASPDEIDACSGLVVDTTCNVSNVRGRCVDHRGRLVCDPPPAAKVCFDDPFDGTSPDFSRWIIAGAGTASVQLMDGVLVIMQPVTSMSAATGLMIMGLVDMRGADVEVELVEPIATANATSYLMVQTLDSQGIHRIGASAGMLEVHSIAGDYDSNLVRPLDPTTDRYWRIRHDDSTDPQLVRIELSADRASWKPVMLVPVEASYAQCIVGVFVETTGAVTTPGTAQYDNFRLSAPVCPQP